VALDGSYDFQTNRAEMGEKIAVFFRSKVGVPTTVVGLPETERPGADLAPTAFSATLAALDAANILFLGPGSPSRALFRWAGTPIVDRLVSRIHAGATLITSSAAAAASGESAIPVYEIYKAGLSASTSSARYSAFALRSCRTGTTRKGQLMTHRAALLAT
jgi:cyanophycinase-like exopeptidase